MTAWQLKEQLERESLGLRDAGRRLDDLRKQVPKGAWKDRRYHVGLSPWRVKSNGTERIMAEAWAKLQQGDTLSYLLSPTNQPDWADVSTRDAQVAATVLPWLGSPVGYAWIREMVAKMEAAQA